MLQTGREVSDAVEMSLLHTTAPTTKTHLALNANSVNVEKSCSQMSEYIRAI